jgi:molybdopterin-guanine dinucleotide biosynthesis protein A
MHILLVGVQKRMIINPKIEVSIPLLLVEHAITRILKQEKHVSIVTKRDISQVSAPRSFWIKRRKKI